MFGQYRGRTFKWLLEIDIGYSVIIFSAHQREWEAGKLDRSALMCNKDAFPQYACAFKEVAGTMRERRQREVLCLAVGKNCLVGVQGPQEQHLQGHL